MNEQKIKQIKSKAQRLETLLSTLQNDVELLKDSDVDVSGKSDISKRQIEIQEEVEQLTSDLLLLLDESGGIECEDREIRLPNPQRNPVLDGDLPKPTWNRKEGRGAPKWVKNSENDN